MGSTFTKNVKPYKKDGTNYFKQYQSNCDKREFNGRVWRWSKKNHYSNFENNSIIISEDEESQGISIIDINENKIITSKDKGIKVITTNSDISIESAMAITMKSK